MADWLLIIVLVTGEARAFPTTLAGCAKIEDAVASGAKLAVRTDDGEFPIARATCVPGEKAEGAPPIAALSTRAAT